MVGTQPRKLSDFEPLTPAERKVLDELDTGYLIVLGDGSVPDANAGDDRCLRARFLRWTVLACEGIDAHRLHEKGLLIAGALITGEGADHGAHTALDLDGAEVSRDLMLVDCRFTAAPNLSYTRMQSLFLDRSHLPGLEAHGLESRGDVTLRQGRVTGRLRLTGARIGGDLDCDGAALSNPGDVALLAELITTRRVSLRRAKIVGGVRLLGARISNDLSCVGATVSNPGHDALSADGAHIGGALFLRDAEVAGGVRLVGVQIGGYLDCKGAAISNPDGNALSIDGAQVDGGFVLRGDEDGRPARIDGKLDLSAAKFDFINDDPQSWPSGSGSLVLDRCIYGAFTGNGVSAHERIDWLALQDPWRFGQEFWPQPYEQCAKVFREMGHPEDARDILIEKERLQRAMVRRRLRERGGWPGRIRATGRSLWDGFLAFTVRYGRRPLDALWWLVGLWLLGLVIFWWAWNAGEFKPNNSVVLRSTEWYGCAQSAPPYGYLGQVGESQLDCFLRQPQAQGYPAFNASIYSLDVVLPVVELEQQKYWVPDEDQWGGWFVKGWLYIEIVMGWLLSLLAVAGLSGLIRSD